MNFNELAKAIWAEDFLDYINTDTDHIHERTDPMVWQGAMVSYRYEMQRLGLGE
jgi:hypothetical protein